MGDGPEDGVLVVVGGCHVMRVIELVSKLGVRHMVGQIVLHFVTKVSIVAIRVTIFVR